MPATTKEGQVPMYHIHLRVLNKVDPHFKSLEAYSGHVILHRFQSNGEWEEPEMNGAMFVYQRDVEPTYGLTIYNQYSQKTKFEPLTKQMRWKLKSPFLMYKNKNKQIFGIWFSEEKDCEKVSNKIISLVNEMKK